MSWHYLQGREAVSSGGICWDGERFAPSKSKTTLAEYCSKDNETEYYHGSRYGMILQHLTVDHGKGELISFPGGSLVKTFQQQEKELASRAKGRDSGEKWPGWLTKYDQDSSLWKTAQCSLLGDWELFSETWPKWGIMHDGVCWELMTPERRIEENGFGFWHTPVADDALNREKGKFNNRGEPGLSAQVKMWPTPDKNMSERGTQPEWKRTRESGHHAQYTINQAVRDSLHGGTKIQPIYPTPTARDYRSPHADNSGSFKKRMEHPRGVNLVEEMQRRRNGNGGQLNPPWVEWLMGWPIGWTDLKPLETDKFRQWRRSHSLFCQKGFYSEGLIK